MSIEKLNLEMAHEGIEKANRFQLIVGEDLGGSIKERYHGVAAVVSGKALDELEHVLQNSPDNRWAVITGWLSAQENIKAHDAQVRTQLNFK